MVRKPGITTDRHMFIPSSDALPYTRFIIEERLEDL
jgi:hypothetical protein